MIGGNCRLRLDKSICELTLDNCRSLVFDLLEDTRELVAVGRDIPIENGCGDLAEVFSQILVITAVGYGDAGRDMNEQFVDDQPVGAKRDQLVHREAAVVAQLMRFCDTGRDVLAAEYRRKRQMLARQLRI